jgi:hypothetical protein
MSAISVDQISGKLMASASTIERLRALCTEDAKALGCEPPEPVEAASQTSSKPVSSPREQVVQVAPSPSDAEIEALLGSLMATVYVQAMKSFEEARKATVAGQPVAMRDIHIHQGARLTRACAEVAVALARHKEKPARIVMEHHHHHAHRRIA